MSATVRCRRYTSAPYIHGYCVVPMVQNVSARLGVIYNVKTTMTLVDGSTHSTYATTTVPGTNATDATGRNGGATQQNATMFRTELKLPAAMRAW